MRLLLFGLILLPAISAAQAARIGRLPLFDPPKEAEVTCKSAASTPSLQNSGFARVVVATDNVRHRMMSVGLTLSGKVKVVSSDMHTVTDRRSEGEMVMVFFDNDGNIVRGNRTATTSGMPSRSSEDRRSGLLPADTAQIRPFVMALRKACHV